jgi:DNA-directed RNA polymerase subunit L
MDIEILKNEKDYVEVAIKGEDIGFINAITELLFEDADVEFAAYRLDHPIVGAPVLMVRMKKGSPVSALRTAVKKLKKQASDFKDALTNAKKVKKK